MNKNTSSLKNFLQKREQVFYNGNIEIEKGEMVKRDETENSEKLNEFNLLLKISTNTKSPIQKDVFGNWNEIIDGDCFDEALTQELFCFLDHKMDSEHTLASTRNQTMELFKIENAYIARVKLFRNNTQHQQTIEKIESGLINSNSFIFQPIETDFLDANEEGVDVTVVHKKGRLISVDPVILPFYPTNTIEFKEEIKMELEKKEKPMEQTEPLKVEMTAEEAANFYKAKYEELLSEKETAKEIEDDDSKPSTETSPQVKEPSGEPADVESEEKKAETPKDEEEKPAEPTTPPKDEEDDEKESNIVEQRDAIKRRILKMNDTKKRNYTFKELENKIVKPSYTGYVDRNKLFNEDEKESLNEYLNR